MIFTFFLFFSFFVCVCLYLYLFIRSHKRYQHQKKSNKLEHYIVSSCFFLQRRYWANLFCLLYIFYNRKSFKLRKKKYNIKAKQSICIHNTGSICSFWRPIPTHRTYNNNNISSCLNVPNNDDEICIRYKKEIVCISGRN